MTQEPLELPDQLLRLLERRSWANERRRAGVEKCIRIDRKRQKTDDSRGARACLMCLVQRGDVGVATERKLGCVAKVHAGGRRVDFAKNISRMPLESIANRARTTRTVGARTAQNRVPEAYRRVEGRKSATNGALRRISISEVHADGEEDTEDDAEEEGKRETLPEVYRAQGFTSRKNGLAPMVGFIP
uniref:Uncharacterized protein n=1 Tax=Steinernema glaseri TaxID=37863 RepID=A0A1I7YGP1_9BILA